MDVCVGWNEVLKERAEDARKEELYCEHGVYRLWDKLGLVLRRFYACLHSLPCSGAFACISPLTEYRICAQEVRRKAEELEKRTKQAERDRYELEQAFARLHTVKKISVLDVSGD